MDVGPGSFTGVRIGVSLVNAMAFAIGRKVIAVDALYALYEASGESARPVCAMSTRATATPMPRCIRRGMC